MDLTQLAKDALECLLARRPITVTHPTGKAPEGFPLPMVRNHVADASGAISQNYRPMAILEYVDRKLSEAPVNPPMPTLPRLPLPSLPQLPKL